MTRTKPLVSCFFVQVDIDRWRIVQNALGAPVLGYIDEVVENREYKLTWRITPPSGRVLSTGRAVRHNGTRTYTITGKTLDQVQTRCLRAASRMVAA